MRKLGKLLIIMLILQVISTACKSLEEDKIQDKLDSMTLEEKAGQLLIVGFKGTFLNDRTKSYINDLKVGGLILFDRNIESKGQIIGLVEEIKGSNAEEDIPLFLCIDEEGGSISRLPKEYRRLPDPFQIGETNDVDIAFQFGQLLGNRVKGLGLNLNFAPVLDIHSNPDNPVIGKRAYGTNPERVSDIGLEVAKGIRNSSIIPAVKHFPGHGDTSTDSHLELPIIDKSLEELRNFELIPFEDAIENNIEMIMMAHILLPSLDKDYPATLSKKIVHDLLRDEMGYEGVIVSDDMTMGAIVNNFTLEDACIDFLKAGGDILLVCHGEDNPRIVFDKIIDAVEIGELSMEEIDEKVYRILELKDRYLKVGNVDLNLEELNNMAEEIKNRVK
ncbi:MAG: beta-N-acetylhexosaminidase [Tissierellaceae bacterium]|jgi:beta-N-acetylhexosaminidase|nr:beta-N-acetylhexosaminidase [Tissierellia bacterium]